MSTAAEEVRLSFDAVRILHGREEPRPSEQAIYAELNRMHELELSANRGAVECRSNDRAIRRAGRCREFYTSAGPLAR